MSVAMPAGYRRQQKQQPDNVAPPTATATADRPGRIPFRDNKRNLHAYYYFHSAQDTHNACNAA
eukprot:2538354-Pyramimonas_sp.AAC.1